MTTTHDQTNWRDYADKLTPNQLAYLERWEANPSLPVAQAEHTWAVETQHDAMLFTAKECAETNALNARFADFPAPPDAQTVDSWSHWGGDEYYRPFTGTVRRDGGVTVSITGRQQNSGAVEREIQVTGSALSDDRLTATEARIAAPMLLAAADELDRIAQTGALR
ncbi:MAG: hypothetical protein AB7G47_09720 [Mycolicibacterium sp.]|uniref:hypothetical protein n=1 Tax=Mycolicibacterium sp. TaxID=2320850 RepID=UPI003D0EEAED